MTTPPQLPTPAKRPHLKKRQVQLIANGDLRLSANQNCWPEQEKMEVHPDRHVLEFDLPELQQPATIVLKARPQKIGSLAGRIGIENGQALSFGHFIYP